ncbi:MAG: PSD1 and planctomycete cytochrome C domain-containing protein [Planctomycetaceae bacterium]
MNLSLNRNDVCCCVAGSCLRTTLCLMVCLCVTAGVSGDTPVDYERQIKPILAKHCFACHGALRQQSGLRLDAVQLIRLGGDRGPAIEPGRTAESVLIEAVLGSGDVEQMPPEEQGSPLSEQEITLLKSWITQGAHGADEPIPADPRSHWAYQRPVRPRAPVIGEAHWQQNPIDAFLAATHQRHGLVSAGPATKEMLLRRVYLDLTGLPPTREELHSYLRESADTAYEAVVDRLLSSPQYGERWGRHWMDVWRYTDWSGLDNKMRHSQKHIWRWRDWIIESLNQDKGYDRMAQEMLAGYELDPASPEVVRATGFLARNWYLYNRNFWLDDIIEHTSKGFLGVTLNCARCHEHKYDPISHEDYYRFRAFFEPHDVRLDPVGMETDLEKDGLPRVYDANPQATTFRFIRGEETRPDQDQPHLPGIPAVLGSVEGTILPVNLPVEAYFPALRPNARLAVMADADASVSAATEYLNEKRNELTAALGLPEGSQGPTDAATDGGPGSGNLPASRAAEETGPVQARREVAAAELNLILMQADRTALEAVFTADLAKFVEVSGSAPKLAELTRVAVLAQDQAAILRAELELMVANNEFAAANESIDADDKDTQTAVADAMKNVVAASEKLKSLKSKLRSGQSSAEEPHAGELYPPTSTGRRLALARWIADRKNPLTARVAVNHVWSRHFGTPLVDSMFDFGLRTKQPENHQLLNWLAVEFMEHSWSMKYVHRLIVTSGAYRMRSSSAGAEPRNTEIDPDNRLLWRMNPRRMEAELVRDTLICLTGKLDSTMSGPDLPISEGNEGTRRTIYYRYSRDHQIRLLTVFNPASVEECYRRQHSIVPQQALAMSNSKMVLTRGRQLAAWITAEVGHEISAETNRAFIESAFERVLGRSALPSELDACVEGLSEYGYEAESAGRKMSPTEASHRARENVVHVLLNHNDFITIR